MLSPSLSRFLPVLTLLGIVGSSLTPAQAATLNVPAQYATIQAGVNAAQDGDTVLVADGTYRGDGNRDIDFGGKSLTVASQNGAGSTVIDCDGAATGDGSGNHRGFYLHSGETNAIISGFTIQNGYEITSPSFPDSGYGGGICIINSSVSVQGCTLTANIADFGGGTFNDNFNTSGRTDTIMLTGCTLTGNTALDGGGVFNYNYNPKGGSDTIILTGCIITGNTAQNPDNLQGAGDGGGVYNYTYAGGGTITLTDCAIRGNTAQWAGGGVFNYNYFSNNTITLTNCAVTGNAANIVGGVYTRNDNSGTTALTNCTIAGNTTSIFNNAAYNYNAYGGGTITFTNCLCYGDTSGILNDTNSASSAIVTFCDVQGGYSGTGNISGDPLFVNAANGDYHLRAGSPCLGAGSASDAPATTLDGYARPNPPNLPSIGAFESLPPTLISGKARLQGWMGTPQPLTFTLYPTGTTTGGLVTRSVTPAGDGSFTLNGVPAGTYTLGIQGSYWLKKDVAVDTTGGAVTGVSVTLLGGDTNGDGVVNGLDISAISAAFRTHPGDTKWNAACDLNGDGVVNGLDISLAGFNFRKRSDP